MSLMAMPKNTSTTHYALASVAFVGACLCAYSAYVGAGSATAGLDPQIFVYLGIFMTCAFGFGFVLAGKMLMEMKTRWDPPFDSNHKWLGRFCGMTMLTLGYTLYAVLDTASGFQVAAIWITGAGLLGPTYAILYMDAIMTAEGMVGDCFLILICGIVAFLGTM